MSEKLKGISCFLAFCLIISSLVALIKVAVAKYDVMYVVMLRNVFAALCFVPILLKSRQILHTKKLNLHLLRGFNGLIGMVLWFYLIGIMLMPELIAMTFFVPIVTAILAVLILGEVVGVRRIFAIICGFIGMLVIIRPGFREVGLPHLIALFLAFNWALTNILLKKMSKTESPQTVVLYMSLIMAVASIPVGIFYYQPLNLQDFILFFLIGVVSNVAHIFLSKACGYCDLSQLMPFDFSRLIFASIIAYFFFGELIDLPTLIGALIIALSCTYIAFREAKLKKKNKVYKADEDNGVVVKG